MRNVVRPTWGIGEPRFCARDGERVQIRGLALVGRHPRGGIALQVLDRLEAFLGRELHVAHGHIMLKVHERLELAGGLCGGERPEDRACAPGGRFDAEAASAARACATDARRSTAAAPALAPSSSACARSVMPRQAPTERSRSADRPGIKAPSDSSQASLPRDCENRCTLGVKPPDISTASHGRVSGAPALRRRPRQRDRLDAPIALVPSTVAPASTSMPAPRTAPAARSAAARGHRRSAATLTPLPQIERGLIGGVVAAVTMTTRAPDQYAVAVEIGLRGAREHDAGEVIARKHQRPFDRARREHHLLGTHLPQPLARQLRRRASRDDR